MPRKTREQWFPAAARVLVQDGHPALTIDRLCTEVGVTKGSFYHHFGDVAAFKEAFLDYLEQRIAETIYEPVRARPTPAEQRVALVDAIAGEDTALVGALFRWGSSDPEAAVRVRRQEALRHEFVSELYGSLFGRDPDVARDMTRLVEAFFMGATVIQPPIRGDEYRRLAALLGTIHPGEAQPGQPFRWAHATRNRDQGTDDKRTYDKRTDEARGAS